MLLCFSTERVAKTVGMHAKHMIYKRTYRIDFKKGITQDSARVHLELKVF